VDDCHWHGDGICTAGGFWSRLSEGRSEVGICCGDAFLVWGITPTSHMSSPIGSRAAPTAEWT
jgi:hypothetical protein